MSVEFNDAVNSFYKLKQTYDEKTNLFITKLRNEQSLTKKEKADRFKKFNPKCINCGKDGGTKFIITQNTLQATCGNIKQPCSLNINIQKAYYKPITELVDEAKFVVRNTRLEIINIKLQLLFGFRDEKTTVKNFSEVKKKLITAIENYEKILSVYFNLIDNKERNLEINKDKTLLNTFIQEFKSNISQYKTSRDSDPAFIKSAIELYISKIETLAQKLMKTKYKVNFVDYNDQTEIYTLIQKPYSFSEQNYPLEGTTNKVISFKK